jgi:hypothetical protein
MDAKTTFAETMELGLTPRLQLSVVMLIVVLSLLQTVLITTFAQMISAMSTGSLEMILPSDADMNSSMKPLFVMITTFAQEIIVIVEILKDQMKDANTLFTLRTMSNNSSAPMDLFVPLQLALSTSAFMMLLFVKTQLCASFTLATQQPTTLVFLLQVLSTLSTFVVFVVEMV